MSTSRLVGVLDDTGHADVITEAIPLIGKGEVLVKVHASLISPGTELNEAKAARRDGITETGKAKPFGYQNAGEVVTVGEGVNEFRQGDRVACMGAGYALHSNYAIVPKMLCCKLPENVSYEEGVFAHLGATALNAIRRGEPRIGEYMLVVGLGLVGQLSARLGQISGTFVMGWDTVPFRCKVAEEWGIDDTMLVGQDDEQLSAQNFTAGLGFDMAVMAFGGDGTNALQSVKKVMHKSVDTHEMGRICIVGALTAKIKWASQMGNLDVRSCSRTGPGYHDDEWEHGEYEYPVSFVRWNTKSNMECILKFISEGKLNVKSLITHRLPLSKIDEEVTAHIEHPDSTLGTVLLMDH